MHIFNIIKKLIKKISKSLLFKGRVKEKIIGKDSYVNLVEGSEIDKIFLEDYVQINSIYGHLKKLSVGRNTYVSGHIKSFGKKGTLIIGKYTSIAGRLSIIGGDGYHIPNRMSTYPFPFRPPFIDKKIKNKLYKNDTHIAENKIEIGNDVWIGDDILILKNITIGNGAIIATKSVVTQNVPPYAIVAGNPAKIKKYRHQKNVINMIEKIKWWNWSEEKILKNINIFSLTGKKFISELKKHNKVNKKNNK